MSKIQKQIQCLCDKIEWLEDLDEQLLNINEECELEISNWNSVPLPWHVNVYTETITPWVTEEIWSLGDAVTHDDPANIFNWPAWNPLGLPSHPNAPSITSIVTDWNDSTSNDPSNGTDQFRYWGWIEILQDWTILRDNNANTWERLRWWVWSCCSNPVVTKETTLWEDTPTPNGDGTRGLWIFATLDAWWHFIAVEWSDFSAFGWVDLEISTNGWASWSNFTWRTSTTKPIVECRQESLCYELQPWESFCAPICNAQGQAVIPTQAWASLELCDTVPVADNELDTAIRTGSAWVSELAARCDHNHPIVRQANPWDPVITAAWPLTIGSQNVIRRWSDEESYEFGIRVNVTTTTDNWWARLIIPNISGFQRPIISGIGSYRYSGAYDSDGTGNLNNQSVPQAPRMWQEINHYLFTQQIYIGRISDKESDARRWINFNVKYIRN